MYELLKTKNYFLLTITITIPATETNTGNNQDAVLNVPARIKEVDSIGINIPPTGSPAGHPITGHGWLRCGAGTETQPGPRRCPHHRRNVLRHGRRP